MDVTIPYRFKVLANTAAALAADTGIPRERELVLETDTGRFKIGDGSTAYASLQYANVGFIDFTGLSDGFVPVWDAANSRFKVAAQSGSGGGSDPATAAYKCWDFIDHGITTSTNTGTNFVINEAVPVAYLVAGGGSPGVSILAPEAGSPGICRFTTGGGSNSDIRTFFTTGPVIKLGGGIISVSWRLRIPTLSTPAERFFVEPGLRNVITGTTQLVDFLYRDDLNSGKWQFRAQGAAGTTTTVNTTIAPVANAMTTLMVEINAAGASVEGFIDGVSVGTITTDIPSAGLSLFLGFAKSIGTTARLLDIDYLDIMQTFTTAR